MATDYTFRFQKSETIVRGIANNLECAVYLDGAEVIPTSGSVVVYDGDGTSQSTETFVSFATTPSHAYTPDSSLDLNTGWLIEWTFVISGETYVARNDAVLARRQLYPVISDVDLFRRVSSLNPASNSYITGVANYQDYLDEAWTIIYNRLLAKGNLPNLIMTPSSFRECHIQLTLALIFQDLETFNDNNMDQYLERANTHRERFESEWANLNFIYDSDDDGVTDDESRRPAMGSVWLTSRRG